MEIVAGGRTWRVDLRESGRSGGSARECWEIRFTDARQQEEHVHLRWIPRPERLTERMARRLFEVAGERLWRDPRSGMIYSLQLMDEAGPGGDADLAAGHIVLRFRTGKGSAVVPYELDCPLGLASDEALQALADRAVARVRGASA